MCRGFCKETQKATPNYYAVVQGVKCQKESSMKRLICLFLFSFPFLAIAGGFRAVPMLEQQITQDFFALIKQSLATSEYNGQVCRLRYPIMPELKSRVLEAPIEDIVHAEKLIFNPNEMDFSIVLSGNVDSDISGIIIQIELENEKCKWFTVHYLAAESEDF